VHQQVVAAAAAASLAITALAAALDNYLARLCYPHCIAEGLIK